jgi:hypothetical protein
VAATGGLLSITRFPAANDIFYGSVFHYTAATLFTLPAMIYFIDFVRSGRSSRAIASLICIFLGLLCNEYVIVYSVLFAFLSLYCDAENPGNSPGSIAAVKRAIGRSIPYLAIGGLYWYFRFHLIAEVATNRAYGQAFAGWLIRQNASKLLFYFFGDIQTVVGCGLLITSALFYILRRRQPGHRLDYWWLRTAALCSVWIIGLLAPFSILLVSHARFAKPLEVPLCILIAIPLQLVWRASPVGRQQILQFGLVALMLLALPYQTLWDRYREPLGAYPLALAEAIRTHHPDIPVGSRVVLLYNAPGLASHAGGEKFKRFSFGGTAALQAYFQDRQLSMKIHNLWKHPVDKDCGNCVYLQLLPKLGVEPAERRFIAYRPPYPEEPKAPRDTPAAPRAKSAR